MRYFKKSWPDEEVSQDSAAYKFHSLLKTMRDDHIWAFNKRSKNREGWYARNPRGSSCHFLYPRHPGIVKADHGLLHHCRRMGSNKLFAKIFVCDYTLQHYRDDILRRIKRIHKTMDRLNTTLRNHVQSRTDNVKIWNLLKKRLYFWETYTRQSPGSCWLAYHFGWDIWCIRKRQHYSDVVMRALLFQITCVPIVCSTVFSGVDLRKHQSYASLAFVRGIHRWPMDSPHKGPVTQKICPSDDVIMAKNGHLTYDKGKFSKVVQTKHRLSNGIERDLFKNLRA